MKHYEEIAIHGQRKEHTQTTALTPHTHTHTHIHTNASTHTISNDRNRKAIDFERMVNQRWRVDMGGKRKAEERRAMEAEKRNNR